MFGVKISPFPRFLRALGLRLRKNKKMKKNKEEEKEEDDDEKIGKSRVRKNCSSGNAKILLSLKGIA